MFNINKKILHNISYAKTIRLKKPELKIKKMLNEQIFKWKRSADKNHVQVKQGKIK